MNIPVETKPDRTGDMNHEPTVKNIEIITQKYTHTWTGTIMNKLN